MVSYLQQHPFIGIYEEKVLLSLLTWLVGAVCDKNKVSFSYGATDFVLHNGTQPQIGALRHDKGMCGKKPE